MKTLIKGGTIVTATEKYIGDVLIDGETVSKIGTDLDDAVDKTIDAKGKYLIPGGIDVHTHLDMPFGGTKSVDDFESGTAAGLSGGTTSIIDFVTPARGEPMMDALAERRTAAEKAVGQVIRGFPEKPFADQLRASLQFLSRG